METTIKNELRKHNRFFQMNPNELESYEEWAEFLESILTGNCYVFENDEGKLELYIIKARVDSIRGMNIEVFSNEHTPPHFHVTSAKVDASFTIRDCTLLNGNINNSDLRKIKYWHINGGKQALIDRWNSTRPTKCVVGPYSE